MKQLKREIKARMEASVDIRGLTGSGNDEDEAPYNMVRTI